MKPHILVIDDEEAIRLFLRATLEDSGYEVSVASTGLEGLEIARDNTPDLALLDLMLPDMNGMEVLQALKTEFAHLPVIMLTAYTDTETAVRAMKIGALDYANKPIQLDRLMKVVARGLEETDRSREQFRHRKQESLFENMEDVIPSQSEAMREIYDTIRKISGGETTTVLIQGESGVGKDVVARLIHKTSRRSSFPFLDINCAALPEKLLESELFGHEKGAFTDAVNQKMGLLELTDSGTLFLDEIGEMSLPVQVKLLRVLEKMNFRRVGGIEDITVDVRIVAATNRNLMAQVKAGTFREDLYYRLNVVQLEVPPLRSRTEDILPLAEFFLDFFNRKFGKSFKGITEDAREQLRRYPWPGNIRELKNILERSVLLESGMLLDTPHLEFMSHDSGEEDDPLAARLEAACTGAWPETGIDLEGLVRDLEIAMIKRALDFTGGNQTQAAAVLRLNRDKLRYRLKQYGIKDK